MVGNHRLIVYIDSSVHDDQNVKGDTRITFDTSIALIPFYTILRNVVKMIVHGTPINAGVLN